MNNDHLLSIIPTVTITLGSIFSAKVKIERKQRIILLVIASLLLFYALIKDFLLDIYKLKTKEEITQCAFGLIVGYVLLYSIDRHRSNDQYPHSAVFATTFDIFIDSFVLGQTIFYNGHISKGLLFGTTLENTFMASVVIDMIKNNNGTNRDIILSTSYFILATIIGKYLGYNIPKEIPMVKNILLGVGTSVVSWMLFINLLPEIRDLSNKI